MKSFVAPLTTAILLYLSLIVAADNWYECACQKNQTLDNSATAAMCAEFEPSAQIAHNYTESATKLTGTWCIKPYGGDSKLNGDAVGHSCLLADAAGSCCAVNAVLPIDNASFAIGCPVPPSP
ncbi:hypothetical protein P8C59_000507 [Phyllachora maydis]|uniref:Uncharacterized protein n=1 Tax=Phyllachora maydis TaxID=1825666 RepID=A0AAD9HXS8_9PEZI|nr:hypothetical protein P8C59_000507 [Phyllachora maydis]